ncbi:zincin-like metallopeptidase domain-containing protein [Shinella curvata]|uniref:Zincin-like metallopeptidase domain-containing protein n=1 Tax=Shinella curvata TaxID=1817964 RepID=A0ABT8XLK8_9HYPH|nr:zincin-like metallopeptidase domain-containing protein [Shinella curvata]MCJ8056999.1 zincin-like metallopeptidase domain-containing protein [Shinella curvata]MDO6124603.1 zincin-like metallopeptidase domain-containing protein [Shinella curvata]
MRTTNENQRTDIYSRITDRIIEDLASGVRPWMKPWNAGNTDGRITRPLRHNGQPYSGMNVLLLWSEQMSRDFASSMWMTFKQALELGAAVRKGETGSTVVFASRITKSQAGEKGGEVDREIPFLKTYSVFNVEQIDGLPEHYYRRPEPVEDPIARIENAERFFRNTGAIIRHGGSQAYYSPVMDYIQMPPFETFKDAASYYATLSHEATHWTAPESRVGRDLSRYAKDRSERAREELIAELGSCFLCADLGIVPELEPRPDHASYLQSWLKVLAGDKRAIFQAAAHAQRAAAFLHDLQPDREDARHAA